MDHLEGSELALQLPVCLEPTVSAPTTEMVALTLALMVGELRSQPHSSTL